MSSKEYANIMFRSVERNCALRYSDIQNHSKNVPGKLITAVLSKIVVK